MMSHFGTLSSLWVSKREHAKLILTEKVLRHLCRCVSYIMVTQSRFWELQGLSSNWNARNPWNVIVLKHKWGSLLIGCYTRMAVTWKKNSEKGQELAKPSKCKARNLRGQIFLLQDAQGQQGLEERKATNGVQCGRKSNFLCTAVPSTWPILHNHWLLLVDTIILYTVHHLFPCVWLFPEQNTYHSLTWEEQEVIPSSPWHEYEDACWKNLQPRELEPSFPLTAVLGLQTWVPWYGQHCEGYWIQ